MNPRLELRNPIGAFKAIDPECRQVIAAVRRAKASGKQGIQPLSPELSAAMVKIYFAAAGVAYRFLARRDKRNLEFDAFDVAGQFCEQMTRTGFPTYDDQRPFPPYGITCISHQVISLQRGEARHAKSELPAYVPARGCATDREIDRANAIDAVGRVVAQLPDKMFRAYKLRYVEGLSAREAGKQLGMTEHQFNNLMHQLKTVTRPRLSRKLWEAVA